MPQSSNLAESGVVGLLAANLAKRLAEHDAESMRASIFDSIAGGTFNLDDIIKQALDGE